MKPFKFNRIKALSFILFIETILLFLALTISYNLYFHYTNTKKVIIKSIDYSKYVYNGFIDLMKIVYVNIQSVVSDITEIFNNRELALGFWIIVFIIYALSVKSVRKTIPGLLKSMFNIKLIYWYTSMIIYFTIMLIILENIGLWELRQLKDSVLWFFVVGIVASVRAIEKGRDIRYFITFITDNIKIIALIQFISNMYSFSFISEVVLILIVSCVTIFIVIIDHSPDLQNKGGKILKKFFNFVLIIIGILVIYYSTKLIIINYEYLVLMDKLKDVVLPLLLSLMFVIYIYLFTVITAYEVLFIRLGFMKTIDESLRFRLKIKILIFCNLNISKISNFVQRSKLMQCYIRSTDDISDLFSNYKYYSIYKNNQEDSTIS